MGLIDRERLVTLNLVGIIAGLIIFVSILTPWAELRYTAGIASTARGVSPIDIFNGQMVTFLNLLLGTNPPSPIPQVIQALITRTLQVYIAIAVIAIALLAAATVITFFHGFIGGGLAIIAMLLFSLLAGDLYTTYNVRVFAPPASFEVLFGAGFILAWISVGLALLSQLFRLKAPHLVSMTIFRGGTIRYGYVPPERRTREYRPWELPTVPSISCPRCGAANSPTATFCRKCGSRLL